MTTQIYCADENGRYVISEMKKLLENSRENYEKFFSEFGKIVKEGLHTDRVNCEKIKDIVLALNSFLAGAS